MDQKPHIFLRSRHPLLYKCSGCAMTFEPEKSAAALAEKFRSHLSVHGTGAGLTLGHSGRSDEPMPLEASGQPRPNRARLVLAG